MAIEYIDCKNMNYEEKIQYINTLRNKILVTEQDIKNNKLLYCYGHELEVINIKNKQFKVKLKNSEIEPFYTKSIYKRKIQLSDELLDFLIKLPRSTPVYDIDYILLTAKQIKEHINNIPVSIIFKIYNNNDSIDEQFIKDRLCENGNILHNLIMCNRHFSFNFFDWMFETQINRITSSEMDYMLYNNKLPDKIILKYLNNFNKDQLTIISRRQLHIPNELREKIKILIKLS